MRCSRILAHTLAVVSVALLIFAGSARAQEKGKGKAEKAKAAKPAEPTYPPRLPDNQEIVSDSSDEFLKPPATLKAGVAIAKTPPRVDFLFYPGQNYPGQPWSNWGDTLAINGKYYSSIGDHLAIAAKGNGENGTGTGFVFEYDPAAKKLRRLVDTTEVLKMPAGHYTPGKIHGRLDLGSDGWIYFSTHRGSSRATTDEFHYLGDWIFRTHPESGKTEVVVQGPVAKHCIPNTVLDPERLIFYGGTAAGAGGEADAIQFFAYDVKHNKLLYAGPNGPARYMAFARSTGRVYYVPTPVPGAEIGIRSATQETPQGLIYTVSLGQRSDDATIWSLNTKTEEVKKVGTASVGSQAYVASIDADSSGRYLYYIPGAHGGSERDGTAIVQFDVKTGQKKVLAFLDPFYTAKYGFTLKGTYGTAIDPAGDKLYVTWNVSRGTRAWDCCGLTVIHIPESERP